MRKGVSIIRSSNMNLTRVCLARLLPANGAQVRSSSMFPSPEDSAAKN